MKIHIIFFIFFITFFSCSKKQKYVDSCDEFVLKRNLKNQYEAAKWVMYKYYSSNSFGFVQHQGASSEHRKINLLCCNIKLDTIWGIQERFDSVYLMKLNFYYENNQVSLYEDNLYDFSVLLDNVAFSKKTNQIVYFTDFRGFQKINSARDSSRIETLIKYYHTNPDSINPWLIEKLKSLNYIK